MNSEAVTYSEFSNALSNPVLLGIVNASPLNGSIVIEMAQNLGYVVVDRMLGGKECLWINRGFLGDRIADH